MSPCLPCARAVLGLGWVLAASAAAADPPALRRYEMATQTGMPHLEENLRYAVVRETRCLNPQDLGDAFWMLRDVSLQDCKLVKIAEASDAADYALQCSGGFGTSGGARWQLGPDVISGRLDVRLGGKNMTFYQHITAKAVGPC